MKRRILLLALLLMLLTNGFAERLDHRIDVLRSLGIEITEAAEVDIRKNIDEICAMFWDEEAEDFYSDYCFLLSWLGVGDYDAGIHGFVPYCDDVFAFDAEMYDISGDYVSLLESVARISDGAVAMAGCKVEAEEKIWGTDLGSQTIYFELNGVPREFKAKVRNDWMDVSIIDYLNECLEDDGGERRIWCMLDGGQGLIVFCETPHWAAQFESATGCSLSLSADDIF